MSGSQNRSCCNIIYRLGLNIVMLLTLLLSMLLFAGSFLTTCYADNMETQQVLLRPDNPLWNLLELAGFGLLFCGCLYLYEKIGEKFRRGLLVFTLTFVFGLGILLILFGRTVPAADALSVYNAAAEWILGNTDIIHPTVSYLSYYPQQIGLMAFLELLLRIWNLTGLSVPAWHFIKLVYVCLLCGAIWFQYLSLQYLWPENYKKISCCYLVLVCCNLPMIMYSSFVYGEIPSFAALSVGCYLLLRLLGSGTAPHMLCRMLFTGLGSILFLTLSVMLRKNSLIPVIAVLLVLLFEALRPGRNGKMRLGLLIMAVCLAVTSVGILPLVQKCYEKKAGNTLSSGVTAMSYLAMGMQEASRGCGWYNGFNIDTYDTAGMDTALANEISRLAIDERLTYFREHPGYTADFYLHKHLSQWADGTYASRQATLVTGNSVGVKTTMNRAAVETAATHTYFRPVEAKDAMPANPFQKVRYQVQKVARKLIDRLPGRFLGSYTGDFLQTKQEQTKEDLRKRSQYKQDDQEIECILTDESYLTDSYNRKGEYSHLTTDK